MNSFIFSTALVVGGLFVAASGQQTLVADEQQAQEDREQAFIAMFDNVKLTGSFTVDGKAGEAPKAESYSITSVRKVTGNLWTFNTHIKYGKIDSRLPITVPVVWADGTPMVSLTNATLPGLGSAFSARVIFHDGRYAGTWQHGKVGGHMFGTIEKAAAPEKTE